MSVNMLTIHFIIFYKMIFNKAIPDKFKYNGNSNEAINIRTVYSSILYASRTKRNSQVLLPPDKGKNRTDVSLFVITDIQFSVKISCNLKKKNHTGAYFTIIRGFLEKYKYASLHFHIVKQ